MRLANLTDEQLVQSAAYHYRYGHELTASVMQELIDRRAEAASEHRKLEAGLAYDYSSSLIEGCCALADDWFDLYDVAEFAGDDVTAAAHYLELRGLLQRDVQNPNHVSIRSESEATA